MSRVRVLFLGTPDIARHCLAAMIEDEHYEIVAVVTQPDRPAGRKLQLQPSPVANLATERGIPVFKPEKVSDPDVLAQLAALRAEVVVVVAFGQILKQAFLDQYPKRVVNVHASLLPHLRGAAPIQRALMNGDAESGVSLQVMVRKLDAGPILGERRIPLGSEMNAIELYARCEELGVQLLTVDLMDYVRGNLTAKPQDESRVTLAPKIEKSESEIDWSRDALAIHNQVRGLAMGPVAQSRRAGKIVKVHRTRASERHDPNAAPGQALEVTEKSLLVQCGKGSLELLEIQPESRARMPLGEYLRGYPVMTGDLFGRISDRT